jgi:hypothetical protein
VCDYCQNLGIPHFGGEQPGDTYYYSPLNIFCFGIVDASTSPEQLYAYGYSEDVGAKGGNNVASLVIKYLEDFEWLIPGRCGKRLTVIMDNCAGQNKNGHVLRLALLLVELQFFKAVEFVFYVRGHTKNLCDRMFNLMKKRYHCSQIFSMRVLTEKLNELDNVSFTAVTSDVFFYYNSLLDSVYCKFQPGTVKSNHLFYVNNSAPTVMHSATYVGEEDDDEGHNEFDFNSQTRNRQDAMEDILNNKVNLPPPGFKPLK